MVIISRRSCATVYIPCAHVQRGCDMSTRSRMVNATMYSKHAGFLCSSHEQCKINIGQAKWNIILLATTTTSLTFLKECGIGGPTHQQMLHQTLSFSNLPHECMASRQIPCSLCVGVEEYVRLLCTYDTLAALPCQNNSLLKQAFNSPCPPSHALNICLASTWGRPTHFRYP